MRQHLVQQSGSDAEFKRHCIVDPKTTISEELDIAIPDSIKVMVHESDMEPAHLASPPDQNRTEEQLESISAGLCCW